ncbi:DHH family phosphoesterase [Brevibacillus porteri]|uniref:DHH family phosphoesterase n=1 Tax=Brevibacillus porteri TaxID=2126350 RepID=UPI0036322CA9
MRYKLLGDNDYVFDPIGSVLSNRGIEDAEKYLNLNAKVCIPYSKLKSIDKAVCTTIKHIENKSVIYIMVDPDVDGFTSASILYSYLKLVSPELEIIWDVHKGKEHGIANITIPDNVNLVIVPDSGSNDFDKHKELYIKGIDVIILDHHEVEYESKHAIVINSQISDYPNKNLSGAGIVYKFCKALDDELWLDYADYFLDLVALGNISDSMSMGEYETRYFVNKGLKNINNEFFLALFKQQEYSTKGVASITNVSFYITPLINATIRFGTIEDKVDMFKAFIGEKSLVKYKPRGSDEFVYEPFSTNMARRCYNLRSKQSRACGKIVEGLSQKVDLEILKGNKVVVLDARKELEGSLLSGLIANQIASKYKRPTVVFSSFKNNLLCGSARGYNKSELKDFKDIVLKTGLFDYAQGHANAYGLGLKEEYVDQAITTLNMLLKDITFEEVFEVDFSLKANSISESLIYTIHEHSFIWGKGIEEPSFFISNLPVTKDNITLMGKNNDTVKINNNNIDFIFFKSSEDAYNQLLQEKEINVIGRASVNYFGKELHPRIIVDEYEFII